MILYPAIDLKDGQCVRLVRGEMDQATVFNDDPAAQAMEFVSAGCEWLHLVDLNGAFAGEPVNGQVVTDIAAAYPDLPIQIGGGIRNVILRDVALMHFIAERAERYWPEARRLRPCSSRQRALPREAAFPTKIKSPR